MNSATNQPPSKDTEINDLRGIGRSLADDYPDFVGFIKDVWRKKPATFRATNKKNVALYSEQAVEALINQARNRIMGGKDD